MKPALTFKPMNAGINNQKLALLGMTNRCILEGADICLPDLVNFIPSNVVGQTQPFGDVFDLAKFESFLATVGVKPSTAATTIDSWESFVNGTQFVDKIKKRDLVVVRNICGFFNSLVPKLRDLVHQKVPLESIEVTVQLRVEQDWIKYIKDRMHSYLVPGESVILDPLQILRNVKKKYTQAESIYVCLDVSGVEFSLSELKRTAMQHLGVRILSKDDFFSRLDFGRASNLTSSLIDFEVANSSRIFVGTSRSTFSNMSALAAETKGIISRADYIYNFSEDRIIRRTDLGTRADPREAVCANLVEWFRLSI